MLTPIIGLTPGHAGHAPRGLLRRIAPHTPWRWASGRVARDQPLDRGATAEKSPRRCRAVRVDLIGETFALFEARLRPGRYPRAFGRGQGTGPRVLHLAGMSGVAPLPYYR